MQLRQLSYFVGVAESGSFSRAAAVLSVAQPALSRQVAELERELGVALLVRNGRGVVLTDPGVKFLGRAKLILEDAERAAQEARASKGRPMGVVALGIAPSIGSVLTAPLVSRIRELYPEIHIQLNEAYSGNLHEWLLSGRLDAGILYIPKSVSAANVTRLVTGAALLHRQDGRAAQALRQDVAIAAGARAQASADTARSAPHDPPPPGRSRGTKAARFDSFAGSERLPRHPRPRFGRTGLYDPARVEFYE
jgi:LysR family transcriptional regulator, nitrogen assimilation regulatory protein